ncbi:MAG: TMAO reductase system periplasmic protein TorT [Halieaceae bacterium]
MKITRTLALSCLFLLPQVVAAQGSKAWYPLEVDAWDPPFNIARERKTQSYTPLESASKPWRICVSLPHLKDDYWIAVNFGLIDEARRLGVSLQIFEAGGYENLPLQRQQIEECMARDADGLIISAISADGLNDLVERYRGQGMPVIDLINGLNSPAITARAAADFFDMGQATARYLVAIEQDKEDAARVALFPGPDGAAWVAAAETGFLAGIEDGNIRVVANSHGDTGLAVQGKLVEQALDADPELDYIVGTAVTAEAAVPILRRRGLSDRIGVLAYYYSPGVHRGILRGHILAAPTDRQALLARIALDQVVRSLQGEDLLQHVAPPVIVVESSNSRTIDTTSALPPRGFRPIFSIGEW